MPILNPYAVEYAGIVQKALHVRSTPLAWLQARGDGIVIVGPVIDLRLWLGGVPETVAEDLPRGGRGFRGDCYARRRTTTSPRATSSSLES